MSRKETAAPSAAVHGMVPAADKLLVQQLRCGDAEAGHRFVRDHYPGVYRYLLYLTARPEVAEDLTQETFLQAWRHLDQFEGRAPLRAWLHRIAHREFLRFLRRRRDEASLEEASEPCGADWTEAVELRGVLRTLPIEEREVVILHYVEGYTSAEIARIVGAPAGTVRYRLSSARAHLQRELGEGDLTYLNEPSVPMRRWSWLPLEALQALQARLAMLGVQAFRRSGVQFSSGEYPNARTPERLNAERPTSEEGEMERREFLRQAAVGAAGLMLPEAEKGVVDGRLTQKVTLAFKATALSDLCEHLRGKTGIHVVAGNSVADEKVTVFCEKLPLREVMRQLSRPFGYTWLRSGTPGEYRYELVQDLRSQLLEEELRNRDRNAALVALDREIARFQPYLHLSPDEALERSKSAPAAEKPLLEKLAGVGWGPIQMYFRLSPQQQAALRAGQSLTFSEEPKPGEYPLPSDVVRGVLQCNRTWRVVQRDDGGFTAVPAGEGDMPDSKSVPLTALPQVRAMMGLDLSQSELGQFTLGGASGFFGPPPSKEGVYSSSLTEGASPYAVGMSSTDAGAEGGPASPKLAQDPALRQRVSLQPQPSCHPAPGTDPARKAPEPKVTTADVLEAVHQATRLPIVADFYTRLYQAEMVTMKDRPLFEALDQLTKAMRLRWNKEEANSRTGPWLQFRSATYYHDRPKEVPNRLLSRWAASRRRQKMLTLDEIVEIAQLTDDQLDAAEMREGAVECWGLEEWRLLSAGTLRQHVRFLAEFTSGQRQEMLSAAGLPLSKMSLRQQQGFMTRALQGDEPLRSLDELAGATLRVDYTQLGSYQWLKPGDFRAARWGVAVEPGPQGRRVLMPPVREATPEAALQTARRLFPPVTDAMLAAHRPYMPDITAEKLVPQPGDIAPTELDLVIVFIPGLTNARPVHWVRVSQFLNSFL